MGGPVIQPTPPFMPTQQSAQDYLTALLQHQQQTSGMTQVGAQVPQHTVPQPGPFESQQQPPERAYGPGQGGARKRASMQNFATAVSNLAGQIVQKHEQRKAREQQKIFDNFSAYSKGMQDAQGQMEQGKELVKQGTQKGVDTPEGKQLIEQGQKLIQQGQQSYQQNVTNLNDLTTGKNEKNAKILAKGYGVDDKNAGTPERQAAIAAIKKQNPGMGDQAANLMSRMPSTMQLSAEGQQQEMMRKAGVTGQPATQGQIIKALTDQHNQALKHGIDEAKVSLSAYKMGMIPEYQQDGTYKLRPMTQEERGQYQLAQKGVLAWTLKDGKPVAALRNPQTNQIIPGTENPDLLPPAYLTERLHEGEFTYTDKDGKVWRVPFTSTTKPKLGIGNKPSPVPNAKRGAQPSPVPKAASNVPQPSPVPNSNMPKGSRLIGQSSDPESSAKALVDHRMAPMELPGFGKSREQALRRAQELDPNYNAAQADIDYTQARNPGVQATLKYLTSLTGKDGKSGNLGELLRVSNSVTRTDFPPLNDILAWARLKSGSKQIAKYNTVITEVADQVAKILQGGGTGSGTSDAKLKQAQELFDKGFSKDQIEGVVEELGPLLENRRGSMIGDNPFLQNQFGTGKKESKVIVVSPEDMK